MRPKSKGIQVVLVLFFVIGNEHSQRHSRAIARYFSIVVRKDSMKFGEVMILTKLML